MLVTQINTKLIKDLSSSLMLYIGLTILFDNKIYNKLNFVQSLVDSNEFRWEVILNLALHYDWHLGVDGCPSPFNKMIAVDSLNDVIERLENFSNQELAVLAEFFSHCTRNSAGYIKQYFNLVSQVINRSKKDLFSLRGWKCSFYFHLIPLRDLSSSRDCLLVFGDLVDIPAKFIENRPFKFPNSYFGEQAHSFWLAHPLYRVRDTRFRSFSYGIPKQEVFVSFYAVKPTYEKFLSMLELPLDCQSGMTDSVDIQNLDEYRDEVVETKENKQVASSKSVVPVGYGNTYAGHQTATQSIFEINSQIAGTCNNQIQRWEKEKKLKTLAEKFFG